MIRQDPRVCGYHLAMAPRHHRPHQPDLALTERIGERVRRLRLARELTQQALAGGEYTKAHMSAIEKGRVRPSLTTLEYLAKRLEVPLAAFLVEDPAEPIPTLSRIRGVAIGDGRIVGELDDGRIVGIPITWSERLSSATWRELTSWRLLPGRRAVAWPTLDVVIELETFLAGREGPPTPSTRGRPRRAVRPA